MSDFLTSDRLPGLVQGGYIIAAILFIGALAGLSKHETAKRGNLAGMAGMAIALVATVLLAARQAELPDPLDHWRGLGSTLALIVVAMAIGAAIGAWRARTVEMTGLPELVDGATVYRMTPEEFAAYVPALLEAGAAFIGGCCGTGPDFIRALARKISAARS